MDWILNIINYGLLGISVLAVLLGLISIKNGPPIREGDDQFQARWTTNLLLGGILFTLLSDKLFT